MCSILNAISELDLPPKTKIWIAFSGGLDSTVLLHACVKVLGSSQCRALHVNHQLSPMSEHWVERCATIARQWDVELRVDTVRVSRGNIEQQARLSRYAIFKQHLGEDEYLLTAHHRNDEIETLSWQLLTGRATIGIPQRRRMNQGTLLRPLLDIEKHEIETYANHNDLVWVEDESNTDTSFDRNWLRHELLPQIFSRFPQTKDRILELKQATLEETKREPLEYKTDLITVEELRSWLLAYELNPPNSVLQEILVQINAQADAKPEIKVADGFFVRRFRDHLYLVPDCEVFEPLLVEAGESKRLSNGTLTWEERAEGFSRGHSMICTNRTHLPSDRRMIRQGNLHKKFANLFQEFSIPPWRRDGWPVLCDGEAVVSLVDIATDRAANVWKTTSAFVPRWNPQDEQ